MAARVARAPDADTATVNTGLAAQIVERADDVADLVFRVDHFADGARPHGHFPAGVRLRLLADDHQAAVAIGPAAVVKCQHHETGIGKFRGVPLVEMLANATPAMGQQNGGLGAGSLETGRQPQVAGHAGAVAPDVDGPALHPFHGGMRHGGKDETEGQRRQHAALQDAAT